MTLLSLWSCSSIKKEYYAYEDKSTNSYCTFEVHRQKKNPYLQRVYYRAVSDYYHGKYKGAYDWMSLLNDNQDTPFHTNDIRGRDILYFYMECYDLDIAYKEDSTLSRFISLNALFSVDFIEAFTGKAFNYCSPRRLDENGAYDKRIYSEPSEFTGMTYVSYFRESSDSLSLVWTPDRKKEFLKEPCFQEITIDWFPPYLKRVDKIDYEKFDLPIKKKYLQYPKKGSRVTNEKDREKLQKQERKRLKRRDKEKRRKAKKQEQSSKKTEN
ncbi:hypothetical protein V9L05_22665 (plasmid) [Bernardetia sp. Wsw4-3y2]|uniref:hypothetical protein n=1 Tax=Bernardetia sp. Wsw4-3y2 TaxID=3127471 RepID=UPI0030CD8A66